MADSPRIVLLAFDGFPIHYVQPTVTPNLWRLGQEGGYCPAGGRSGLPSTTYPGFATLLTGAGQGKTGVRTTSHRDGAVPGWAGTDRVLLPTIIHAADHAGWRTATVMGDHKLQKVLRLDELEWSWPPKGTIPRGTELDAHGYPTNAAVRGQALEAAADPSVDLLFVHFNETDTVAHDAGPNAPVTEKCVRSADLLLGEVMDALAADWARTVVVVVSDHDMAQRLPLAPIDPGLGYELAGLAEDWIADGSAAWVRLTSGADHHMAIKLFSSLEGVEGWRWREPSTLLLLAAPGRVFAAPRIPNAGIHGSTSTARTLAIVGGGHPVVPKFAQAIEDRSPRLQDWAPTLAAVLDVDLPMADGVNMLQVHDLAAGA